MAKTAGTDYRTKANSPEYLQRLADFRKDMGTGSYKDGYFDAKTGGYYVVENSAREHKPEEIAAAKVMANNGHVVALVNEDGNKSTYDGLSFHLSYEQRSPVPNTFADPNNVKNAMLHAAKKNAEVSVMYMRKGIHTRGSVEEGVRLFEAERPKYRFKKILVVTENGHVYTHVHNR